MAFRFKVHHVTHLKGHDVWILEGFVESGKVFVGSEGTVAGDESRRVKVKGIAIHASPDGSLSMTIAPPTFPASDLESAVLVGTY
jgi:hypothetical protein